MLTQVPLRGKTALIFGAGHPFGAAAAKELATLGCSVVLADYPSDPPVGVRWYDRHDMIRGTTTFVKGIPDPDIEFLVLMKDIGTVRGRGDLLRKVATPVAHRMDYGDKEAELWEGRPIDFFVHIMVLPLEKPFSSYRPHEVILPINQALRDATYLGRLVGAHLRAQKPDGRMIFISEIDRGLMTERAYREIVVDPTDEMVRDFGARTPKIPCTGLLPEWIETPELMVHHGGPEQLAVAVGESNAQRLGNIEDVGRAVVELVTRETLGSGVVRLVGSKLMV